MLLGLAGLAALAIAAWGWGRVTAAVCLPNRQHPGPAFLTVLGLSAWGLAGGVLNALGLAGSAGLASLFAAGLLLAGYRAMAAFRTRTWAERAASLRASLPPPAGQRLDWLLERLLPGLLVLGALLFAAATLLPTAAFNFHDDFHTYFARAHRLLQTGTLGGDPFDLLGIDSLGSQSLFHATLLLIWPPAFLNGFDAVFCLALSAALAAELVGAGGGRRWLVPAGVLGLLLVHPQVVNISAVFSVSAGVLGLVLALRHAPSASGTLGRIPLRGLVPAGLLLALLTSLKLTFAPFAALFCIAWFALAFRVTDGLRQWVVAGLAPASFGVAFLLPWVIPVWPRYVDAIRAKAVGGTGSAGSSYLMVSGRFSEIWAATPLGWGGTIPLDYLVLAGIGMAAALAGLWVHLRKHPGQEAPGLAALVACGLATGGAYGLNWLIFDPAHALRYACALLLTVPPVAAATVGHLTRTVGETHPGGRQGQRRSAVLTGIAAAVLFTTVAGLFGPLALWRMRIAFSMRTAVSFGIDANYIAYNRQAFSADTRDAVRALQEKTASGTALVSVMSLPFHLDYARNRVLVASQPSRLSHPWLAFPSDADPQGLRTFLRALGVRYVLWEVHGYGMRSEREIAQGIRDGNPLAQRLYTRYWNWLKGLRGLAEAGYATARQGPLVLLDLDRTPGGTAGPP